MDRTYRRQSMTTKPFRRRCITFLLALFAVICILFIWQGAKKLTSAAKFKAQVLFKEFSIEKEKDLWKNEPSDIEGWTKYDKWEAGLITDDGSDTDGDGLTDKEEIEIYQTSATAYSTTGDFYSDGYKVSTGMDPLEYVEGMPDVYPYNSCENVTLNAKKAEEINANVTNITGTHQVDGTDTYAEYKFSYYDSDIQIDLSNDLPDGVTTEDISVMLLADYNGAQTKEIKFHADSPTQITITKDRGYDGYSILICKKRNKLRSLVENALAFNADADASATNRTYLVVSSPLFNNYITTTKIYTSSLATEKETEEANKKTKEFCEEKYGCRVSVESKSTFEIEALYRKLYELMPDRRQDLSTNDWRYIICYYMVYDYNDIVLGTDLAERVIIPAPGEETTAAGDGFTIGYDTFSFPNFGTTAVEEGNCAGLSYAMAECYNSDGLDNVSSGSYDGYAWDLNSCEELATFMDRGVSTYKSRTYYSDSYYSEESDLINLDQLKTEDDVQFLNFVTAYQKYINTLTLDIRPVGNYLHYSEIKRIMALLDMGNVLTLGVGSTDGFGGHELIAYDYEASETNPNMVCIKVYDVNFPDGTVKVNGTTYDGDFTVYVEKTYFNDTERFRFTYAPFRGTPYSKTYFASSDIKTGEKDTFYAFVANYPAGGEITSLRDTKDNVNDMAK